MKLSKVFAVFLLGMMIVLSFFTPGSSASTENWPMYMKDPSHSSVSTSTAPTGLGVLWTFQTKGKVASSPAIVDDRLYIGSFDNKLYCLNANTGNQIWSYDVGEDIESSPAVVNEKVYIGTKVTGWLYCLNAITGEYIWSFDTGDEIECAPAVLEEKVYFRTYNGIVYCLDAITGLKIWSTITKLGGRSSPAVSDGKVYVGSGNGLIHCFDMNTGGELWTYKTGAIVSGSPTVAYGNIYVASGDRRLYCLNANTGEEVWRVSTGMFNDAPSPAVHDGKVFYGTQVNFQEEGKGNVFCLDAYSGDIYWNTRTGGHILGAPAVADGKVFLGSWDSRLYCLDEFTGEILASYLTGGYVVSSPAVYNGYVYIGSYDDKVYCFAPMGYFKSCDESGSELNYFDFWTDVFIVGGGFEPNKQYSISIVESEYKWVDGMKIPSAVVGTSRTIFSDSNGLLPNTLVWANPRYGFYDIVVDVNGDGYYDESSDPLDYFGVYASGFFVVPELPLGTLTALATMVSCVLFKRKK